MLLNCHSFHSLRYGTIPLAELVALGARQKTPAMALTDINTVTGIYDFTKGCLESNIKPLVGIDFRNAGRQLYIGLAKNKKGIGELCRFLTRHNFEGTDKPERAPAFENAAVIYPMDHAPARLNENEYIGVRPEELTRLVQQEWKNRIKDMVVLQPVSFRTKKEYNLHRILRAVDHNILLSKLDEADCCHKTDTMPDLNHLANAYADYPQILENTQMLVENCNFEFAFDTPRNKKYYTDSRESDIALLTRLAEQGLVAKYGRDNKEAQARVKKELRVIDDLGFSGYFLITWDIVRYSNSMGFMHVGRGSGANSIVSYCLGITAICPIELDLYFERFLNSSRKSPPDFDIDWSWKERDTILEYIFSRFGREHVAFCGTNVEFKYRSIFREVGKVFGLPKSELDALALNPMKSHDANSIVRLVQEYGMMLEKYPNQRSMHSCGIIISEEPITNFTALEMPPKGFPIVQFDMHAAEDIGFEKFDILSQRGIGTIDDIYGISFEECANELMALLLECSEIQKLWPKYNRALKRFEPKFGLYSYEARNGYRYLAVGKLPKFQSCVQAYDREHEGMDALRELAQKFEIDPRFCCYGRPESGDFTPQQNTASLPEISVHNASIEEALALLRDGKESYAYLDRGRHAEERSCVYVENGAFYGMGYFPTDASVSDLSELKEYIDPYKSSHYVMKLIASFAARHPGKVKPIKKVIPLNASNFENFD